MIWKEGRAEWKPAGSLKGLFPVATSTAPQKAPPIAHSFTNWWIAEYSIASLGCPSQSLGAAAKRVPGNRKGFYPILAGKLLAAPPCSALRERQQRRDRTIFKIFLAHFGPGNRIAC
jgi:hypothetical protein